MNGVVWLRWCARWIIVPTSRNESVSFSRALRIACQNMFTPPIPSFPSACWQCTPVWLSSLLIGGAVVRARHDDGGGGVKVGGGDGRTSRCRGGEPRPRCGLLSQAGVRAQLTFQSTHSSATLSLTLILHHNFTNNNNNNNKDIISDNKISTNWYSIIKTTYQCINFVCNFNF